MLSHSVMMLKHKHGVGWAERVDRSSFSNTKNSHRFYNYRDVRGRNNECLPAGQILWQLCTFGGRSPSHCCSSTTSTGLDTSSPVSNPMLVRSPPAWSSIAGMTHWTCRNCTPVPHCWHSPHSPTFHLEKFGTSLLRWYVLNEVQLTNTAVKTEKVGMNIYCHWY